MLKQTRPKNMAIFNSRPHSIFILPLLLFFTLSDHIFSSVHSFPVSPSRSSGVTLDPRRTSTEAEMKSGKFDVGKKAATKINTLFRLLWTL
jgi:hypothetical protein